MKNFFWKTDQLPYADQIKQLERELKRADAVIIGAGAGLSASAGLTYSGERFRRNFSDFILRYGMQDMYSAGFYPFQTQEEKWAYWSRHILCNRYDAPVGKAYLDLLELVKEKEYFVLTTNVDHQFWLAGFPKERIFAAQGDYGLFQCAKGCHKKLYDNEKIIRAMVTRQKDCRIPSDLVPKCPVCGGDMEVNLRCDHFFVEDEAWQEMLKGYQAFLEKSKGKKRLFLELGVGMNTPVIIKYPFWQMTMQDEKAFLVSINQGEAWVPPEIGARSLCIDGDIQTVLAEVKEKHDSKGKASVSI